MRKTTPLLALLLLAGCGSSSSSNHSIQAAPSAGASSAAQAPPAAAPAAAAPPASGPLSMKPTIAKPSGPAPNKLVVKDLIQGTGPAATSGKSLSVEYVGVLYNSGKQFDASWDRAKMPFPFTLGQGMVIPGWDQGLVGMKVGGRRQLVIPAALAYGAKGSPPAIPPDAPLIFDVDLLAVT